MNWDDAKIFLALYRKGTLRGAAGTVGGLMPGRLKRAASGPMISVLRRACSHALSGRVAVTSNAKMIHFNN